MEGPERFIVVDASTGQVDAEADSFEMATIKEKWLDRTTGRAHRIDLAGHPRQARIAS